MQTSLLISSGEFARMCNVSRELLIHYDKIGLLPPDRGVGEADVPLAALERIDAAVAGFEFDANDFRDIRVGDVRLISADSVRKLADKLRRIPAGPHRVTLMREELHTRLEARLAQMAGTDETLDELSAGGPQPG